MSDLTLYATIQDSAIGPLGLRVESGRLCQIDFLERGVWDAPMTDLMVAEVIEQLQAYFQDGATCFALPLAPAGTPFQQRVWQLMRQIMPGDIRTYGDLAQELGSAPQAVGNACRANPIPIVIPCHRVVARNGIGGYAGATSGHRLERKRWLLRHEGVVL